MRGRHREEARGRFARKARKRLLLEALEPRALLSTFTVVNLADAGPGSLRQAIVDANASVGADQITFDTPLPALAVFQPLSPLPEITDPVVIDATTEPGFIDRPIVTLDGSLAGPQANGLVFLGGQSTLRGMVITGFDGYGIILSGGGGDSLQGNYVGVDATGEHSQPNRAGGVLILGASNNIVGASAAGGGNVLSGNGGDGLRIVGPTPGLTASPASGNQVLANFIGLDSMGTRRVGNALDGIHLIRATANAIGGNGFGLGNLVSGNADNGIEIDGDASYAAASGGFNRIQGNIIGSDRQTASGLGNAQDGIRVAASANTIGGVVGGATNVIANNAGNGVKVEAQRVSVLSNSIYANFGLGIDLGRGGANGGSNAPTILSLTRSGLAATVTGRLNASPGTVYTLQFFGNPPGETQARVYLGSALVTPGTNGLAAFSFDIPTGVPLGGTVTATATDPAGDTSALSTSRADAPRVLDVALSPNRAVLTVDFSAPMDPSTATDPRNYLISAPKPVSIRQITLSADGLSVLIALKKAVPNGTFARVAIGSGSAPGLTSAQGVAFDGNDDGQPGGVFQGTVAVGANLRYTDADAHSVALQLSKGGVVEAYRGSSGNAESVRLYGPIAGRSILSGSVKGKHAQTPIPFLIGLRGASNRLTNPPFVVGQII